MIRFLITGIIAAAFLGGVAWFNFSFKPSMIKTIMSSQVPPPATVTSEAAKSEQWVEQLTSIGTLMSAADRQANRLRRYFPSSQRW